MRQLQRTDVIPRIPSDLLSQRDVPYVQQPVGRWDCGRRRSDSVLEIEFIVNKLRSHLMMASCSKLSEFAL